MLKKVCYDLEKKFLTKKLFKLCLVECKVIVFSALGVSERKKRRILALLCGERIVDGMKVLL